jgi:DNA (cytosine-5)-methyltransferase 1
MSNSAIFSFFSGAGFLDLGFEMSKSFEIAYVNEYHKPFLETYKYSRKKLNISEPLYGFNDTDICTLIENKNLKKIKSQIEEVKKYKDFIGFIGGPPCPDFSVGGKNRGKEGENGKLSGVYVELICQSKPDFFLFENVKGLYRTKKHKEFFEVLKKQLNDSGYLLTERLINSIEYGVPQDRERIILLGFRKHLVNKKKIHKSGILSDFDWLSSIERDRKEIFEMNWPQMDAYSENSIIDIPKGIIEELTIQHWFNKNSVVDHPNQIHFFQPRAGLAKFKVIPEGDDLKKSFKRLHRWRYSPTAAYGNNEVHLHPYKSRRITVAEALAIQSLPRSFEIPDTISLSDMFKTVGNGVPFLAAKEIANSINRYLSLHLQ